MEIKKIYYVVGTSHIAGESYFGSYLSFDSADEHLKTMIYGGDYPNWSFRIKESYALYVDGEYFQLTKIPVDKD